MTRGEYKARLKAIMGLDPNSQDGNLTDVIIHEVINDAMDDVVDSLDLIMDVEQSALIKDEWRYALPPKTLSVRDVMYLDTDNIWLPLQYQDPELFLTYFDQSDTDTSPHTYTISGRSSPTHNFATDSGLPVARFIPSFFATETSATALICYGANFGDTEAGERIRKDDRVWNREDDSYGFVDYLDFTVVKQAGTITTATLSIANDTSATFSDNSVAVGDVIRWTASTGENTYAFVSAVNTNTQIKYTGTQGNASFNPSGGDTYSIGTSDKIVLKTHGTSSGRLRGGSDNTFTNTDSGHPATTISTVTTTTTNGDTLGGTFDTSLVSAGMVVFPATSPDKCAEILSVSSSEIIVDFWIGGVLTASTQVLFGTGDKFSVESKFRTRDSVWIKPIPNTTDDGIERLKALLVIAPQKPDDDGDPIEIDDRYREVVLAKMRHLAAERMATFSTRELADFEAIYEVRLAGAELPGRMPSGQQQTIIPDNFPYRNIGSRTSRDRLTVQHITS